MGVLDNYREYGHGDARHDAHEGSYRVKGGVLDNPREYDHGDARHDLIAIYQKILKLLKIKGKTLDAWAQLFIYNELQEIRTQLEHGVIANESSSDIAHRVVGSLDLNGTNGATERTRKRIRDLGKAFRREKLQGNGPEK